MVHSLLARLKGISHFFLATGSTLLFGISIVALLQFSFEGPTFFGIRANSLPTFTLRSEREISNTLTTDATTTDIYAMAKRPGHFVCMIRHGDETNALCDDGGNKEFFAFGQIDELGICQRLQDDSCYTGDCNNDGEPDKNAKFRFQGPNGEWCEADSKNPSKCDGAINSWDFGQCAKCGQYWDAARGVYASPIEVNWDNWTSGEVTVNRVYGISYWPYIEKFESGGGNDRSRIIPTGSVLDFKVVLKQGDTVVAEEIIDGLDSRVGCTSELVSQGGDNLWDPWGNPPKQNNKYFCTLNNVQFTGLTLDPGKTYGVEAQIKITEEASNTKPLGWQSATNCSSQYAVPEDASLTCDSKTIDKEEVVIGDTVTFTVTYSNNGGSEAQEILFREKHLGSSYANPRNFRFREGASGNWNNVPTMLCNETLLRGEGCMLDLSMPGNSVAQFAFDADIVSLNDLEEIAFIRYDDDKDTNDCPFTPPTGLEPVLVCNNKTIEMPQPEGVKVGDNVTFHIQFSNNTRIDESIAYLQETAGTLLGRSYANIRNIRINGASYGGCSVSDLIGNGCKLPMIEGNHTYTFSFDATVTDLEDLTNTAVIRYGEHGIETNPNHCTVRPQKIVPTVDCIEKTVHPTVGTDVKQGDIVTYTVRYDSAAQSGMITVEDSLPAGLEFIGFVQVPNSGNCDYENGHRIICELPGNESGEIFFSARVLEAGEVLNTAKVLSVDARTGDDYYDTCSVSLNARELVGGLTCLAKTADVTEAEPRDLIEFTVTYENTGEIPLSYIELTDSLPDSFIFIESEDCEAVNDRTLSCVFEDELLPNETVSVGLTVLVSDGAVVGNIVNNVISNLRSGDVAGDVSACVAGVEILPMTCPWNSTQARFSTDIVDWAENLHVDLGDSVYVGSFHNGNVGADEYAHDTSLEITGPGIDTRIVIENGDEFVPTQDGEYMLTVRTEEFTEEECSAVASLYVDLPTPGVTVDKETKSPADRTMVLGEDAETPEDYVRYKITVTNTGPTTLIVVPLNDIYSADDYEFVSSTPAADSVTQNVNTIVVHWNNLGTLEPGESIEVTVILKALEGYYDDLYENRLPNFTRVDDAIDENDVETDSNLDMDYVDIIGSILGEQLDVNIQKTLISDNPVEKGDVVKFHIVVTNTGERVIESARFVDIYDTTYLKFKDFSSGISHRADLYTANVTEGIFTHENILYELDPLNPGDKIEFDIWFTALAKGETVNHAKVIVEDKNDTDDAAVKIIVEELADTGQNILPVLLIAVLFATPAIYIKMVKKVK